MFVSIVIPTYNESDLYDTLVKLRKQTVFDKYETEIIIADYDPQHNEKTWRAWEKFYPKEREQEFTSIFVGVFRKGIAYARHEGIRNSSGKIIVNFDADAHYNRDDAIELCIDPIIRGEAVITCCDNLLNPNLIDSKSHYNENVLLVKFAYTVSDQIQQTAPIVTLEPGMCFTRHAYDYVGGFQDVKQSEAHFLSAKIIYNFGLESKKHIKDVTVFVSPRRALASAKLGIINTWFNYDNAFRMNNKTGFDSFNL